LVTIVGAVVSVFTVMVTTLLLVLETPAPLSITSEMVCVPGKSVMVGLIPNAIIDLFSLQV